MKDICWECMLAIACFALALTIIVYYLIQQNNKWWGQEFKFRTECLAKNGSVISGDGYSKTLCLINKEIK